MADRPGRLGCWRGQGAGEGGRERAYRPHRTDSQQPCLPESLVSHLLTGYLPPGACPRICPRSVMHDLCKVKKPWWCTLTSTHIYKDKYIYIYIYMYVNYSTEGSAALLDQANEAFWFGYYVLFCYLFLWLVLCCDSTSASPIALYYR